jgi:hypothetical protein
MMELKRISDPQLSPDGKWVTFTVQTVDVAANKKPSQIWIVPVPTAPAHAAPDHARWRIQSAGALVARFQADRVYFRPRRLVADLAHGPRWRQRQTGHQSLHRGRRRAVRARWQEPALHQRSLSRVRRRRRLQQEEPRRRQSQQGEARIYTELLYRHWTAMADRAPQPSAGGPGDRRRGGISRPARTTCRRFRWAVPTITTFRPTARKSATP